MSPSEDQRSASPMHGVVKRSAGIRGVALERVAVPEPRPGEALLEVVATGICGTDVHIAHDEYGYEAPVVMGHEILGRVVGVGSDGDRHWLDSRVACETYFSTCERCMMCRDGRRNLCPDRRSLGSYENGGFAEFVVVPTLNLHAVPDHLDSLEAVLAEPLACVTNCLLDPPRIDTGSRVYVVGPGAIGQISAQVARAVGGAVTLGGLPRDGARLDVARAAGVDVTTEAVPDNSFDVVIEASGSEPGARAALHAARRGGRYVQVGIFGDEVRLPFDQVLYKELTVSSGFASTPSSWRRAMRLLDGRLVDLGSLVTNRIALKDVTAALEAVERGEGLKTVVVPSGKMPH